MFRIEGLVCLLATCCMVYLEVTVSEILYTKQGYQAHTVACIPQGDSLGPGMLIWYT